ncbi:MAG: hypothetical protein K2I78_02085, partial [Clostridia bacterium]|nr:hypothetical protein [Clostridia bacterium]
MKKAFSVIAVALVVALLCASFAGCAGSQNGEIQEVDYSLVLKDYLKAPDGVNLQRIHTRRDGATASPVDVTAIYDDDSLTIGEKIAEMVYGSTMNEIACDHFAYFTNKVGSTNLGSKEGSLIYQRLRRQSDDIKDDTTIKLPINHNFDALAANFVTSADIRYISDGIYNRMQNKSDIKYNFKTGILEVSTWKKKSGSQYWNNPQSAVGSRSFDEARKSVINWRADGIVSEDGAKIEVKTDDDGNVYYELTFSIDVEVANNDKGSKDTTIGMLENDNGGENMTFEYCNFVVQIWECGLAKRYDIDESWSGKIQIYNGSAKNKQTSVFSYSDADMDYSATEAI